MAAIDLFVFAILFVIMLVILFLYLLVRRSVLGFREGVEEGRR